jgi:hypothetical protein
LFFFFIESETQKLDALMAELQKINSALGAAAPTGRKWVRGDLACVRYAEDGLWYRVRLVEGPSDRRFKIHYLDFGNNEVFVTFFFCMCNEFLDVNKRSSSVFLFFCLFVFLSFL